MASPPKPMRLIFAAKSRAVELGRGPGNPTVIRQRRLPGAEVDVTPEVRIAAGAESSTRLACSIRLASTSWGRVRCATPGPAYADETA